MYTGPMCNFCNAAKRLFSRNNIKYQEIDISTKDALRDEMIERANGLSTVPQIFINDKYLSDCDGLYTLEQNGTLDSIIEKNT